MIFVKNVHIYLSYIFIIDYILYYILYTYHVNIRYYISYNSRYKNNDVQN